MEIRGQIKKIFYREGNFSIGLLSLKDPVATPSGKFVDKLSIKGNFLEEVGEHVVCSGDWEKNKKTGNLTSTFWVKVSSPMRLGGKDGIIAYLNTIRGVGVITANNIYRAFGNETYEILDNDITRLSEVGGIGDKMLKNIMTGYAEKGQGKELFLYLYSFGVSESKIGEIYARFKNESLQKVKEDPYLFVLINLLKFQTADRIGRENGIDKLNNNRIKAAVIEVLANNESKGNTYASWGYLLYMTVEVLLLGEMNERVKEKVYATVKEAIKKMEGIYLTFEQDDEKKPIFYLKETGYAERNTAKQLARLLKCKIPNKKYGEMIKDSEKSLEVSLSEEQEIAVNTVMNSSVTIVTGGPGTGKSTFQSVLLDVFKKEHPEKEILLAAPTGRAARRMTECSGMSATTIHQLLKLSFGGESTKEDVVLDAGLVVIDEVSMLDIFIASKLFSSVSNETQIVLIGDSNQLPSVGAGAVLKSMIDSKLVPVVKFTKIFRQSEGSSIAVNADKINREITELEYDNAFVFREVNGSQKTVNFIKDKVYNWALDKYGIDEVAVLTPFRKNTATGVNQLNPILKEIAVPYPKSKDRTTKLDGADIYVGDKVMYLKNDNGLTNGDIGYITRINIVDKEQVATVDFMDGGIVKLEKEDLRDLVPAYSTTVHKSQGSEYKCVIMVVDPTHSRLLKKNLVYTAITRAKEQVIIIGSKSAFLKSIVTKDTSLRVSMLTSFMLKEV